MLGFAAHNRNRLVGLIEDATADDPQCLAVTYEELAVDPTATVERILDFAGVASRTDLDRLVASRRVADTNDRWRSKRSAQEAALLDEILSPEEQ
jgi:hypothetical protein